MKIWTCSMYSGLSGSTFILGVFSDVSKAEQQARVWLQGIGEMCEETDRTNDPDSITIYYQTMRTETPYTATIEQFELDNFSF